MSKSRFRILRWAACLALATAATFAAAPASADAAITGGASPFSPPAAKASGQQFSFSPWRSAGASWYGPGLYGNRTACGGTLRKRTIGVAHKTLPCGTTVKFAHRGRVLVTRVIDRGPYIRGRAWDLTQAASAALDFERVGVGKVRYAVATTYARVQRR